MTSLEIWMLGVALAMDCLAISLATGMSVRRMVWRPMMTMALSFGIFQGGMTLLGFCGLCVLSTFVSSIGMWVAAGLLLVLGIKMVVDGIHERPDNKTVRIPTLPRILIMAVATSIDAFAVGVSFACMGYRIVDMAYPVAVIGFCSWILSVMGLAAGICAVRLVHWRTEPLGGVVLILLGSKIIVKQIIQ